MALLDESEEVKPEWYRVNLPSPYDRIARIGDEIYIRIAGLGLTKPDVVSWLVETETGSALKTQTGEIYLSGQTTVAMLEASSNILPAPMRLKRRFQIMKFEAVLKKINRQLNERSKDNASKEDDPEK
jgi:hypothetical protein